MPRAKASVPTHPDFWNREPATIRLQRPPLYSPRYWMRCSSAIRRTVLPTRSFALPYSPHGATSVEVGRRGYDTVSSHLRGRR